MNQFMDLPSADTPRVIEQLMALYQFEVNQREDERRQTAAYLNDMAIQTLSALLIQFSLLPTAPEAELRRELTDALPLLTELVNKLNSLSSQLHSIELDTLGLHETISLLAETLTHTDQLKVMYEGSNTPEVPTEVAIAFYRLAQEVLTQLQAHPQVAEVLLKLHTENQGVRLTIQAKGNELRDLDSKSSLLGLMVRFERLNGRLIVDNQSNEGITVTAVWPWSQPASPDPPGRDPVQDEPS